MNPCAGKTDLPDFESGPFSHLGTSPLRCPKAALYTPQSALGRFLTANTEQLDLFYNIVAIFARAESIFSQVSVFFVLL